MALTNFSMCTLEGWMVNQLGLKGNDLIAYAAINMICSYPGNAYSLDDDIIESWLGCTKEETTQYIDKFLKSGIIKKAYRPNEFVTCN